MKLARRSFFQALATAPLAAKAAADASVAEAMKLDISGLGNSMGVPLPTGGSAESGVGGYENSIMSASRYVKLMGFPDFMEREIRQNTKHVYGLDYDIANKKSWSLAVKIQTQRQRNFERAKNGIHDEARRYETRSAFKKITGWPWPW